MNLLRNLLELYLDAAPWLLLGLLVAGLLKSWLPEGLLRRKLGEGRFLPIAKAAFIGAPLPLCSCGVLPAAMGLHRSGASKSATLSFMISTPETGPDSIALTYALLGPFMAVVRPVAAILSALFTGLLTVTIVPRQETSGKVLPIAATPCGCGTGDHCESSLDREGALWQRTLAGLNYAFHDIFDDIWRWLFAGLILAAAVMSYLPSDALAHWGNGLSAMLMMLVVGMPMYICATASTPLAAAMMLAGISPGTVLVFLLAGPATNLATMGVIYREMGARTLVSYLLGIALSSVLLGLATNTLAYALEVPMEVRSASDPVTASWLLGPSCGLVLLYFTLRSLGNTWRRLGKS